MDTKILLQLTQTSALCAKNQEKKMRKRYVKIALDKTKVALNVIKLIQIHKLNLQ